PRPDDLLGCALQARHVLRVRSNRGHRPDPGRGARGQADRAPRWSAAGPGAQGRESLTQDGSRRSCQPARASGISKPDATSTDLMRFVPVLFAALFAVPLAGQAPTKGVTHGQRPSGRLAIRNALVIQGNGTPAEGPYDILIENNRIVDMVPLDPVALKAGR